MSAGLAVVVLPVPPHALIMRERPFVLWPPVGARTGIEEWMTLDEEALQKAAADCAEGLPGAGLEWITLEGGNTLDEKVVRELVTDSYRLVVGRLPKSRQPVDPRTYGRLV
ncbi:MULTISPECIES: hypothetical protein [unclassified Streptomyces]|uniref:hypothetical protein n=1 Tax=unclassified Streptomyces TaxID=2593676 RepID=UPI00224C83D4|nr:MULTISPECIES: hypothetical protein [unclassified Streptomyces]MCX5328888.1 hypothetical protein [Streptomyces sp. NBC_00140]